MNTLTSTLLIGAGATAMMDIWGFARRPLLGIAAPDYGLVGRWFAHMTHGQFRHESIGKAAAVSGERLIGWVAHYLTGIAYAVMLVAIAGRGWLQQPAIGPAMLVGICTVAAPFLLMQPAMGAGIAASRNPHPGSARLQSLIMHAVFGLGLYAVARALQIVHTS